MINLISISLLLSAVFISAYKNKDLFSPVKIYSFFSLFFYLDIFLSEYIYKVELIYLLQNFLILIISFIEPKNKNFQIKKVSTNINLKKTILLIWVLSLIPIGSQLYIIKELGGISEAINNIANRVLYFRGRGYLLVLNSFFIILHLLYFSTFLTALKSQYTPLTKIRISALYLFHFTLFICIGLLSGSRSFIIMTLLIMLIIYNYIYKAVTIKKIFVMFLILTILVSILGTLRNNKFNTDINFDTNTIEISHFKYGLIPLEIIFKDETLYTLQYGQTYLSFITNFIPRQIWANKLLTGGEFFTREYANDQWGGASHLATGAITEGIINFGGYVGIIVGALGILFFYYLGILLYIFLLRKIKNNRNIIYFSIIYVYFILLAARYSYSDFGYVLFSYVTNIACPIIIFVFINKIRLRYK